MRVVKGHATGNDFVIVDDRDGKLELSASLVRALCDRHTGVGADGVLRVVRASADPGAPTSAEASGDEFFMDYRNADGSLAEMCGNGARLFLRYLQSQSLVGRETTIVTRGGNRRARSNADDSVTIEMGPPTMLADRPTVAVAGLAQPRRGVAVLVPNPHVVLAVDVPELAGLDLNRAPVVEPPLPEGQNVEFVVALGPSHIAMRVHERGVGETRSCGTGICAAVVASGAKPDGRPWTVDVPGGQCEVNWRTDGELELRGPAVIVATIELSDEWLGAVHGADSADRAEIAVAR
jgi:diaminopimelate epimerase